MAERKIRIRSGEAEIWMEVTEEEYQNYYRPWWQQKKREQRNRETMEKNGYTEESYEEWKENGMWEELLGESVEEWLDGFNTFSIYQVLPELIKLWGLNVQTDAEAKKTPPDREGNDHAAVPAPVRTAGDFDGRHGASVHWVDQ